MHNLSPQYDPVAHIHPHKNQHPPIPITLHALRNPNFLFSPMLINYFTAEFSFHFHVIACNRKDPLTFAITVTDSTGLYIFNYAQKLPSTHPIPAVGNILLVTATYAQFIAQDYHQFTSVSVYTEQSSVPSYNLINTAPNSLSDTPLTEFFDSSSQHAPLLFHYQKCEDSLIQYCQRSLSYDFNCPAEDGTALINPYEHVPMTQWDMLNAITVKVNENATTSPPSYTLSYYGRDITHNVIKIVGKFIAFRLINNPSQSINNHSSDECSSQLSSSPCSSSLYNALVSDGTAYYQSFLSSTDPFPTLNTAQSINNVQLHCVNLATPSQNIPLDPLHPSTITFNDNTYNNYINNRQTDVYNENSIINTHGVYDFFYTTTLSPTPGATSPYTLQYKLISYAPIVDPLLTSTHDANINAGSSLLQQQQNLPNFHIALPHAISHALKQHADLSMYYKKEKCKEFNQALVDLERNIKQIFALNSSKFKHHGAVPSQSHLDRINHFVDDINTVLNSSHQSRNRKSCTPSSSPVVLPLDISRLTNDILILPHHSIFRTLLTSLDAHYKAQQSTIPLSSYQLELIAGRVYDEYLLNVAPLNTPITPTHIVALKKMIKCIQQYYLFHATRSKKAYLQRDGHTIGDIEYYMLIKQHIDENFPLHNDAEKTETTLRLDDQMTGDNDAQHVNEDNVIDRIIDDNVTGKTIENTTPLPPNIPQVPPLIDISGISEQYYVNGMNISRSYIFLLLKVVQVISPFDQLKPLMGANIHLAKDPSVSILSTFYYNSTQLSQNILFEVICVDIYNQRHTIYLHNTDPRNPVESLLHHYITVLTPYQSMMKVAPLLVNRCDYSIDSLRPKKPSVGNGEFIYKQYQMHYETYLDVKRDDFISQQNLQEKGQWQCFIHAQQQYHDKTINGTHITNYNKFIHVNYSSIHAKFENVNPSNILGYNALLESFLPSYSCLGCHESDSDSKEDKYTLNGTNMGNLLIPHTYSVQLPLSLELLNTIFSTYDLYTFLQRFTTERPQEAYVLQLLTILKEDTLLRAQKDRSTAFPTPSPHQALPPPPPPPSIVPNDPAMQQQMLQQGQHPMMMHLMQNQQLMPSPYQHDHHSHVQHPHAQTHQMAMQQQHYHAFMQQHQHQQQQLLLQQQLMISQPPSFFPLPPHIIAPSALSQQIQQALEQHHYDPSIVGDYQSRHATYNDSLADYPFLAHFYAKDANMDPDDHFNTKYKNTLKSKIIKYAAHLLQNAVYYTIAYVSRVVKCNKCPPSTHCSTVHLSSKKASSDENDAHHHVMHYHYLPTPSLAPFRGDDVPRTNATVYVTFKAKFVDATSFTQTQLLHWQYFTDDADFEEISDVHHNNAIFWLQMVQEHTIEALYALVNSKCLPALLHHNGVERILGMEANYSNVPEDDNNSDDNSDCKEVNGNLLNDINMTKMTTENDFVDNITSIVDLEHHNTRQIFPNDEQQQFSSHSFTHLYSMGDDIPPPLECDIYNQYRSLDADNFQSKNKTTSPTTTPTLTAPEPIRTTRFTASEKIEREKEMLRIKLQLLEKQKKKKAKAKEAQQSLTNTDCLGDIEPQKLVTDVFTESKTLTSENVGEHPCPIHEDRLAEKTHSKTTTTTSDITRFTTSEKIEREKEVLRIKLQLLEKQKKKKAKTKELMAAQQSLTNTGCLGDIEPQKLVTDVFTESKTLTSENVGENEPQDCGIGINNHENEVIMDQSGEYQPHCLQITSPPQPSVEQLLKQVAILTKQNQLLQQQNEPYKLGAKRLIALTDEQNAQIKGLTSKCDALSVELTAFKARYFELYNSKCTKGDQDQGNTVISHDLSAEHTNKRPYYHPVSNPGAPENKLVQLTNTGLYNHMSSIFDPKVHRQPHPQPQPQPQPQPHQIHFSHHNPLPQHMIQIPFMHPHQSQQQPPQQPMKVLYHHQPMQFAQPGLALLPQSLPQQMIVQGQQQHVGQPQIHYFVPNMPFPIQPQFMPSPQIPDGLPKPPGQLEPSLQ